MAAIRFKCTHYAGQTRFPRLILRAVSGESLGVVGGWLQLQVKTLDSIT